MGYILTQRTSRSENTDESFFIFVLRIFGEPDPSDFLNPIGMAAKPVKPSYKSYHKIGTGSCVEVVGQH